MHIKDLAQKLRQMSVAALAVLAGLFILAVWFISLGPQGVQPRAAEPMRPAPAVSAFKLAATAETPSTNALAPVEHPPAPAIKERTKAIQPHKTDSAPSAAASSANTTVSAKRTSASDTKDLPPTTPPRRSDSRPTKAALPAVAEVSTVVLPAAASEVKPALPAATLEIEVDHKFAEAQLSIWVDDTLTYTHELEGTAKKRLVVFHHVEGHELHAMQVSPGKHRLRVRVTSDDPTYDHSAFVTTDLTSGQESTLRVTFNRHGDLNLALQ